MIRITTTCKQSLISISETLYSVNLGVHQMFPCQMKVHPLPPPHDWNLLAGQHRRDNSQHQPARINTPPSHGQQRI